MDLKKAELRKAELMVQRLDLYAAVSGQACDANIVFEVKQAYESIKVIVGNMQRNLMPFDFPMKTSKASSSTREVKVVEDAFQDAMYQ